MLDIGADRGPGGLAHPDRQQVRHAGVGQAVNHRGVDPVQLGLVEPGRGSAEMGQVEGLCQLARIERGIDRIGGAEPRQKGNQRLGLDPVLTQRGDAQRAEPLGKLALGPGQQRLVGKAWGRRTQRGEHLHLGGGVGDMILAAQHVGDAHRDIVDHAGEQIEPRTVGAAHHRIAHLGRIEMLGAADPVGPFDWRRAVQQKAPVRALARRLAGSMIGFGERQRGAVIDRRQAPAEQDLALQFQFLRGLVAAIDPSGGDQLLELGLVKIEPGRLALFPVPIEAQPFEIGLDRGDMLLAAAFQVGIVDPQQEPPAGLLRQHPVVQRGAHVAHVQRAGRAGGEAGGNGHGAPIAPRPRAVTRCGTRG